MIKNYYNEKDPFAANWLRNLIIAGHIAPGVVDERSIEDVRPDDLAGFTQCHFFAGIGIWSLGLRRAGWSDDRAVWTGSCPCQPFSAAGKIAGFADERHVWPALHYLIEKRGPPVFFGEQVASATEWLGLVQSDLEAVGYSVGSMPIEAASAGALHLRDRIFLVADTDRELRISGGFAKPFPKRTARDKTCDASLPRHPNLSEVKWIADSLGKKFPFPDFAAPMANANSSGMDILRAIGNALDVEVTKAFISAYLDETDK